MKIYLADLFHVYTAGRNTHTHPYTVPLGIAFLASTLRRRMTGCEVRLFRDPDRLLNAVRTNPPDMIGFSFCSWNLDLTRRVSEIVKSTCPDVITVAGGPCVDDADEQIVEFFEMFPTVDYVVPSEGEAGFLALVQTIALTRSPSGPIAGVGYLDASGSLVRGRYERPIVPSETPGLERISPKQVRPIGPDEIEIPSPYLDGTLDEFLDEGLVPIVQTMRGCPYQCHFCVSGATEWNNMRGYSPERVKAEIDYALSRSGSKDLILTDENWGILGDRDVALAHFIMDRYRAAGAPNRLYYYTAKIVTPASREIVETVAPIAWIGEFNMSYQTVNPESRKAIKRTNIGLDKLAANVQWAHERNILTSSEMIYGFPYETPETFFDGVERLGSEGVDKVIIFPLHLFPGIDLASRSTRDKYGLKTRFRFADCSYGIYDNGNLVSAEAEELVVSTRWSSEDDYGAVRRYGFFQEVLLGRRYLGEFCRLCLEAGISGESVVRHLTRADYGRHPALSALLADHARDAEAELKGSRDEVYRQVSKTLRAGQEMAGVRLNLVYLGRLMSSAAALREFLQIILEYFEGVLAGNPQRDALLAYLTEVLPNRIVLLSRTAGDRVTFRSRFDYAKWLSHGYGSLSDLLLPEAQSLEATISDPLKQNLSAFDPDDPSKLQGIFEKTNSKYLLRTVRSCRPDRVDERDRAARSAPASRASTPITSVT